MPKKLKFITIPLYIGSTLSALILILLLIQFSQDGFWRMFLFWDSTDGFDLGLRILFIFAWMISIGYIITAMVVAFALKKRKKWAWILSWFLTAAYLPSLFFPLGISMLIGILDKDVKEFFSDDRIINVVSDEA